MIGIVSSCWMGIDLGTYNSCAAIKTRGSQVELIKCADVAASPSSLIEHIERQKEFPSFISFDQEGLVDSVGMAGKEKIIAEPERVVWGVKRLLGRTYSELKESGELARFPYRIRPNRKNGQCIITIGEHTYTPEQLCAEIFRKIKQEAEHQLKHSIDSVVVSVPAYFDPVRVTPIIEAAKLAGFIFVKTIPEPVAAALAFDITISTKPVKVLVFDLGGGTLDVTAGSIYHQTGENDGYRFQVVKTTGDTRLGGIDIDDRLLQVIQEKCGIAELAPSELSALRRSAEIAKIRLSAESEIEHVVQIGDTRHSCRLSQFDLRRALEGHGAHDNMLEACRHQLMSAIDGAGWVPEDIEHVFLIGGPTKLPCIQEVLQVVFHGNPRVLETLNAFMGGAENVDRMSAVATGAALSVDRRVDDKVPAGFGIEGIEINGEEMTYTPKILIPRDSGCPYKSASHLLSWINVNGLFEFKILQHVPQSEIRQFGYEYKFVGIQKFAVKNPHYCMVAIEMGYTDNKELTVTIKNLLSDESVTYQGLSQSACIGMRYPLKVQRPPQFFRKDARKLPPEPGALEAFGAWARATSLNMKRRLDNSPLPQMLISQLADEIDMLLRSKDIATQYEKLYTKLHGLIWNANSHGVLSQSEYTDLANHLAEHESALFRMSVEYRANCNRHQ